MKYIKIKLLLSIIIMLNIKAISQNCNSCSTYSINLSTGINVNGSVLPVGSNDPYWQMGTGTAWTNSGCSMDATMTHCTSTYGAYTGLNSSQKISYSCTPNLPGNGVQPSCGCISIFGANNFQNVGSILYFRTFTLCSDLPAGTTYTLSYSGKADDYIDKVSLVGWHCTGGSTNYFTDDYDCGTSGSIVSNIHTLTTPLKAGTYQLKIKCYNFGCSHNNSDMQLEASLNLGVGNNVIMPTKQGTNYCNNINGSPVLDKSFGNAYAFNWCSKYVLAKANGTADCDDKVSIYLKDNNNSLNANIPLVPVAYYTVVGPISTNTINPVGGVYTLGSPGIYTLTVSDGSGCTQTATYKSNKVLITNLSTNPTCIPSGGVSTLTCNTNSLSTVTYSLNNGIAQLGNTFPISASGVYTVSVKNAVGCTASSTVGIGEQIVAKLWAEVPFIGCFPTGSAVKLYAYPFNSGNPTQYTYNWSSNTTPIPSTNVAVANAAGLYTVVVSDAYGCSSTSFVNLQPTYTYNLVASPSCLTTGSTVTITASSSMTIPTYSVVPGSVAAPISGPPVSVFTLNIPGTSTIVPAGIPTLCVTKKSITVDKCADCMNLLPGAQVFTAVNSSTTFPTGFTPTTPIYFTGNLTVNSNLTINNNQNVFFAAGCNITVMPGASLTITYSHIRSCNTNMWQGINQLSGANSLLIQYSNIEDMEFGIDMQSIAAARLEDNLFINSGEQSVKVNSVTAVNKYFSNCSFLCNSNIKIRNSSTVAGTLAGVPDKPKIGILFYNTFGGSVGINAFNVNYPCTFDGIMTGIKVAYPSSAAFYNVTFNFDRNNFTNISNVYIPSGNTNLHLKTLSPYYQPYGTAIYSDISNTPNTTVTINANGNASTSFTNCDKGIVLVNASVNATHLTMTNTLLGIFCSVPRKALSITDCNMTNAFIGISGNNVHIKPASATVLRNNITTRNLGIWTNATGSVRKYPVGIEFFQSGSIGSTTVYFDMRQNVIHLLSPKGVGVALNNLEFHPTGAPHFANNEVFLENFVYGNEVGWSAAGTYGPKVGEVGYKFLGTSNLLSTSNRCFGNHDNVAGFPQHNGAIWQILHPSAGMLLEGNINLGLSCNNITRTVYGLYIIGDNEALSTSNQNVRFNNFNANYYPWYCADGTPGTNYGTLRDIGNTTAENGNQFVNTIDLRATSSFNKVDINRQTAVTALNTSIGNTVTSDAGLIQPINSISNQFPMIYSVTANLTPYTDPCLNTATKMALIDSGLVVNEDEREEREDEVITDSVSFTPHEEVLNWMQDWYLYARLDADENRRLNYPELEDFYSSTSQSPLGKIYAVEKALTAANDNSFTNTDDYYTYMYNVLYAHQAIATDNPWEQAYLAVQALKIKVALKGIASIDNPEDLYALFGIANSCIYTNALAVYEARNLYTMYEPATHFNDYYICSPSAAERMANSPAPNPLLDAYTNDDFLFQAYPVPASHTLNFRYLCPLSNGIVYLYNAQGMLINSYTLPKGIDTKTISVENLQSGVYTYKVVFDACGSKIGKISILH